MKESKEPQILEKIGRRSGMTVPEGYFEDFGRRMDSMLPDRPELTSVKEVPRSFWHKIRPYTYMAAMFAGIWCMLKLFTLLTASSPTPLEANPVIAEAVGNDAFVNEYVLADYSQWDIYQDLMDDGFDPEDISEAEVFESDPEPVTGDSINP